MPKSRHKLPRSKRRKGQQGAQIIATPPQPIAQSYRSAPQPKVPAPTVSVPTTTVTPAAAQHPYILLELRRTGILGGIIVAILIVLVFVLS